MANIKELILSIEAPNSSFDEKLAAITEMQATVEAMQAQEEQAINDNVDLIVEAIKVMEKKVSDQLEIAKSIVPEKGDKGDKGEQGAKGRDGLDGKDGRDGRDGIDGKDGKDGISVTDAKIDFDGSLIITLSTGKELNVGEVVTPDLAERIAVIGTMSTNTAVAGITSGTIDGAVIGGTTPAAGTFTTLTATSTATLGGDATAPALVAVASAGNTRWLTVTGSSSAGVNLNIAGAGNGNLILIPRGTGGTLIASGASSSNVQFAATHTASAVNYVQVTGAATGNGPDISAQGSDASVDLRYSSKGTSGTHVFRTNGTVRQFQINHVTSAVNYGVVTGSIAGNAVPFTVAGSDTNISQVFQSKGTGAIDLAAGSSGVNISNGSTVTALTRTSPGGSYTSAPTPAISAPTTAGGVQATATCTIGVATSAVSSGGTGYTLNDVLTFSGGTFTAAATATVSAVSGGVITAITMTSGGTYTVAPTNPVSVTGGTGTSATFTLGWGINSTFTITNAGSGYVEQPTVSFSGGGGSGAAAYATVGSGTVVKSVGTTMSFYTPGGETFRVVDGAANIVNWIQVTGSVANAGVQLRPGGSDTNVAMLHSSKGTSQVSFYTNTFGQEQLRVSHTASAVNYVQVTGAATGGRVTLSSQGSDGNIGTNYQTKGNGQHIFYTSAGGSVAFVINGTGTANYIQTNNAAAGSAPSFQVAGTDTNIDLTLTPKGTGKLVVTNGIQGGTF